MHDRRNGMGMMCFAHLEHMGQHSVQYIRREETAGET
jgi:hypothetical protein